MKSEFEHDATPTWSGFIYQGNVAIYLAVHKICELLSPPFNMDKQVIAETYKLEVENWEDIAIVREDEQGKCYLSIHQAKNRQERNINDYKKALVQLMLEKSKLEEFALGTPEAYLHTSGQIREGEEVINQLLHNWNNRVLDFYNNLEILKDQNVEECDKSDFQQKVRDEIEKEPIGLNRSNYINLLKGIKSCIENDNNVSDLKEKVGNLWSYLKNELAVEGMGDDVKIYTYEDEAINYDAQYLFQKIVEQVRRYKDITHSQDNLTEKQYEYIADKLLNYMRNFISIRHQLMQKDVVYSKSFSFQKLIEIMDDCVNCQEKEANVMALRRRYDETMSQFCRLICQNECEEENSCECRLLYPEYSIADLDDENFIKLCFGYNPDCDKRIEDRACLGKLLDIHGLQESVFVVLKEISKEFFRQKDERMRVVINDQQRNAFLTAIASGRVEIAVENIVKGIGNNASMVSPIFDADELITNWLHSDDEGIWDNNYSEINEKYLSAGTSGNSDNNQNSICQPKKPKFVTAREVVERLR